MHDFDEVGVTCKQVLILHNVLWWSQGADVRMKGFSAFLDMRRCKDWDHEVSLENIYLKTCSTSFPGAQSTSLSTLNSFQGMSKVNICNSTEFNIRRVRWQIPLASASLWLAV